MRARRPGSPGDHDTAVARQAASLLLGYPDEQLVARLTLLAESVAGLATPLREPLERHVAWLAATPLEDAQQHYVDTFDLRRRSCLYLTYYSYGDTRKRGMALLRFKHAYASAGMELGDDELPDHLSVVLEFAATVDGRVGTNLLNEHRAGLELIRIALEEAGSPYADVVLAVTRTLSEMNVRDREAAIRLAQSGPPTEEVGLDPYGTTPFAPPEYMGAPTA